MDTPDECQSCVQEKTIHLTQIIDNEVKKVGLCESCPFAKKIGEPSSLAGLDSLMSGSVEQDESPPPLEREETRVLHCERCGFTSKKLSKSGQLGCPDCYQAFGDAILDSLVKMHRGVEHVGKVPQKIAQLVYSEREGARLKKALDQAVAEENYEEAARLRDAIGALPDQVSKGAS